MNAALRDEAALFKELDVAKKLKKLKRLEREFDRSDDQDLILEKIQKTEHSIADWIDAKDAADNAKSLYREAGIRDEWKLGKSREQKYTRPQLQKGMEYETEKFKAVFDDLKEFHNRILEYLLCIFS